MSHTYEDLAIDYEFERQEVAEEWDRHISEAVGCFVDGRLRSYYVQHPDAAQKALGALSYSRDLLIQGHAKAAVVFAVSAIEIGYKAALLRPIVSGLVHTEGLAEGVMILATGHTGIDRFFDLLTAVLDEFGSVDLKTFVRSGAKRRFWDEMKEVSALRNDIIHRGDDVTLDAAATAVEVAEALLNTILPAVLHTLALELKSGRIAEA
jgi:hypothetical protein